MPRILHLIETGGPGGAERIFLRVAAGLEQCAFDGVLAVGREGWLAREARRKHSAVEILNPGGSINVSYLRTIIRLTKRHDASLIVAHMFGGIVYSSLAYFFTGVPVVGVLHGQSDVSSNEKFLRTKRFLIRHGCKRVVFVSASLKDHLQPRLQLPPSLCMVIENGIDHSIFTCEKSMGFRKRFGLPEDSIVVGSVGNIRPAKGYNTLIEAAAIAVRMNPKIHFLIVGDTTGNTFPAIKTLRASLGLDNHVHFAGLRPDVADILANMDLFVLSSTTEGFSLALVEAMASGCASIATRSGGPEQIIADEDTGVLVPPGDPASLSNAILQLAQDTQRMKAIGQNARRAVIQKFSASRMTSEYLRLVKDILRSS